MPLLTRTLLLLALLAIPTLILSCTTSESPPLPTSTPAPESTATPTSTLPSNTPTAITAPTPSPMATPTSAPPRNMPTPVPTQKPEPTPAPTSTPMPTPSPTPTPMPTPTFTPVPTVAEPVTPIPEIHYVGNNETFVGESYVALKEAEGLLNDGEYQKAVTKYKEVLAQIGRPSEVVENQLGLAYYHWGKYDLAISHFSNSLDINDDATTRINRASARTLNGQCDGAIQDAQTALRQEPATSPGYHTDVNAHLILTECYMAGSENAQALQHVELAISKAVENQYNERIIADLEGLKRELASKAHAEARPTPRPTSTPRPTATPRPAATPTPTSQPRNFRLTPCRAGSTKQIAWSHYPSITNGGYLIMSGRTTDGAQIHDARSEPDSDGNRWRAFGLHNLYVLTDERRLKAVGKIWPKDMADRLSGGGTPNVLADVYDVTDTEFHVEAQLPASLLDEDMQLVVSVWGVNPGQTRAIGAECVSRE